MNKIVVKALVWSAIIITWILTYSSKVWIYDINIKYWVVPDAFNQTDSKEIKTKPKIEITKENKEIPYVTINDNSLIEKIFNDALSEENHWVSDNFSYSSDVYKQICETHKQICDFVSFNWDFSEKEKISYIWIIVFIINKFDENLVTNDKIKDTLYSLRLNKAQQWRRGLAWHHTITINLKTIENKKEFSEVLTHELGHIIDLGILNWYSEEKDINFTEFDRPSFSIDDSSLSFYQLNWIDEKTRKSRSSFKDFVSWYGMSDPFEDFAECINLYMNHYSVFEEMAENNYVIWQKFSFVKDLFWENYIFTDTKNYKKLKKDPLRRPWDSTKIK